MDFQKRKKIPKGAPGLQRGFEQLHERGPVSEFVDKYFPTEKQQAVDYASPEEQEDTISRHKQVVQDLIRQAIPAETNINPELQRVRAQEAQNYEDESALEAMESLNEDEIRQNAIKSLLKQRLQGR